MIAFDFKESKQIVKSIDLEVENREMCIEVHFYKMKALEALKIAVNRLKAKRILMIGENASSAKAILVVDIANHDVSFRREIKSYTILAQMKLSYQGLANSVFERDDYNKLLECVKSVKNGRFDKNVKVLNVLKNTRLNTGLKSDNYENYNVLYYLQILKKKYFFYCAVNDTFDNYDFFEDTPEIESPIQDMFDNNVNKTNKQRQDIKNWYKNRFKVYDSLFIDKK